MITFFWIWLGIAVWCGFCWSTYKIYAKAHEREAKLWQHILDLEADKRALTESLCRAQGSIYIPPRSDKTVGPPSDGWFDGVTHLEIPE